MQKTTIQHPSYLTLIAAAISAKLHSFMDKLAPVGYQDETGFHTGTQRASK